MDSRDSLDLGTSGPLDSFDLSTSGPLETLDSPDSLGSLDLQMVRWTSGPLDLWTYRLSGFSGLLNHWTLWTSLEAPGLSEPLGLRTSGVPGRVDL